MPSSAVEILPGSRAVYWAPWLLSTPLPLILIEVPAAWLRSCRTARGRAWLLNMVSAVARAAATVTVRAAATMTRR